MDKNLSISRICRICSVENANKIDILGFEGRKLLLQHKIRKYLSITITNDDDKPKVICNDCFLKIETFHKFAEMAFKAQEKHRTQGQQNLNSKPENKGLLRSYLTKENNETERPSCSMEVNNTVETERPSCSMQADNTDENQPPRRKRGKNRRATKPPVKNRAHNRTELSKLPVFNKEVSKNHEELCKRQALNSKSKSDTLSSNGQVSKQEVLRNNEGLCKKQAVNSKTKRETLKSDEQSSKQEVNGKTACNRQATTKPVNGKAASNGQATTKPTKMVNVLARMGHVIIEEVNHLAECLSEDMARIGVFIPTDERQQYQGDPLWKYVQVPEANKIHFISNVLLKPSPKQAQSSRQKMQSMVANQQSTMSGQFVHPTLNSGTTGQQNTVKRVTFADPDSNKKKIERPLKSILKKGKTEPSQKIIAKTQLDYTFHKFENDDPIRYIYIIYDEEKTSATNSRYRLKTYQKLMINATPFILPKGELYLDGDQSVADLIPEKYFLRLVVNFWILKAGILTETAFNNNYPLQTLLSFCDENVEIEVMDPIYITNPDGSEIRKNGNTYVVELNHLIGLNINIEGTEPERMYIINEFEKIQRSNGSATIRIKSYRKFEVFIGKISFTKTENEAVAFYYNKRLGKLDMYGYIRLRNDMYFINLEDNDIREVNNEQYFGAILHMVDDYNNTIQGIKDNSFDDLEVTEMEVDVDPMLLLQYCSDDDENGCEHGYISDSVSETYSQSSCPLPIESENQVEHVSEHHIYKPFLCHGCNKPFPSEQSLQEHLSSDVPKSKRVLLTNSNNLICEPNQDLQEKATEDETIYDKSLPNEAKGNDGGENVNTSYPCLICGKIISTKGNLKVHLETHRPKGKYACDICGRIFKTQCNLYRHKEYHGGVQFPCETCGRVYPTNSTLRAHSITHSNLRPHKCPLCVKTFKRNQDLKFHINQHTGARPYKCPYCPKAFASSGNCFSHRKRMHPLEVERDRETAAKIMR